MANARSPNACAVPSLAPPPVRSKGNQVPKVSGAYKKAPSQQEPQKEPPKRREAIAMTAVRHVFESELPPANFELELAATIGKLGGPLVAGATRQLDESFEDDDDETSSSILELQMEGLHVREEAWPKATLDVPETPMPRHMPTESKPAFRAIPPPPAAGARNLTPFGGVRSPTPYGGTRKPTPPPTMARGSSSALRAVDTTSIIAAFAGYGDPPASIFETTGYWLRVRSRRRALKADLESARRRRSPEVSLFEAALDAFDARAARTGLIFLVTSVVLVVGLLCALGALLAL
jgi:hypothetical protein